MLSTFSKNIMVKYTLKIIKYITSFNKIEIYKKIIKSKDFMCIINKYTNYVVYI